ncbi:UbiA 4-hydroxybenzoate polyprenyltransferase and related prenyltransferases [Candidatus Nanopelagicaceae bacterium]
MKPLLKASHFGPTVIVVSVTYLLALSQYSALSSLRIAVAIFAGQLVVGWSNDLMDYDLDKAAGRTKKPLISGELKISTLRRAIPFALISAVFLSLLSPLGVIGTLIHLLGVLSALAYNAKFKATILSPLPYAISFGGLPWAIYLSNGERPPVWLFIGFILISISFHFLNVLKDLSWDIEQGVLGLPQRIGRNRSIALAITMVCSALIGVLLR